MITKLFIVLFIIFGTQRVHGLSIPTDQVQHLEGKRIYVLNCVRCHNTNPHKPGIIGPDLFSTPIEVFRTKVPGGTYPSDYKPKRKTRVMPKFPHLREKTDLIYKYIQSIKSS